MSAVDTRNLNRDSLFLMADLVVEGAAAPQRAKVRNLSPGGMMAESEIEVERGARITVELRNIGKVQGSVAWIQGNRFGVAFEQEIDPMEVRLDVNATPHVEPHSVRAGRSAHYDRWTGRIKI